MKNRIVTLFVALLAMSGMSVANTNSTSQSLQGAESDVNGSISSVSDQAKATFKQLGIAETGFRSENNGAKESLTGKKGDLTVNVELNQSGKQLTHVGVIAKNGPFQWNKDYARNVLSKIMQKAG